MIKNHVKLDSFVLVEGGTVISPALTTTRAYGNWLPEVFDEYTVAQELYLKSKVGDTSTLESHPGTRIGNYFDVNVFNKHNLKCWYINSKSAIMKRLIKYRLAELGDCSKKNGEQMLRVYTVDQIELYIRTKLDRSFTIGDMITEPKQIVITREDDVIRPAYEKRKGLF